MRRSGSVARGTRWVVALLALAWALAAATAQAGCQITVAGSGYVPHGLLVAALAPDQVRITFAGHASFMVESPEGVGVFTDYNGVVRPKRVPDIVTMNPMHSTHHTDFVEPEIKHVLRGWDPNGGVASHDIKYKDMRVRNVPTNLRDLGNGRLRNDNSIFIMEAAGICVVHLSHTHHVLSPSQLQPIKDADVLLVPIDGSFTMSHDEAFHIIDQVKPRVVIPMHYGSTRAVQTFIARATPLFPIREQGGDTVDFSLKTLPKPTEVLFLETRYF